LQHGHYSVPACAGGSRAGGWTRGHVWWARGAAAEAKSISQLLCRKPVSKCVGARAGGYRRRGGQALEAACGTREDTRQRAGHGRTPAWSLEAISAAFAVVLSTVCASSKHTRQNSTCSRTLASGLYLLLPRSTRAAVSSTPRPYSTTQLVTKSTGDTATRACVCMCMLTC
jgi:hypothetical protein